MNVLLKALEEDGIVTRTEQPVAGRALPTALTDRGRQQLVRASSAVKQVEAAMSAALTVEEQEQLRGMLSRCVASLGEASRTLRNLV
jgi:DNA-binding MarR family transcriptional regulator